ncbi:MAG: DUF433 domain-containing protein [Acidobacteriota bacterium]
MPITSDPAVMMGKPVIAGTGITVELILENLEAGESFEQILVAHPRLTEVSLREALSPADQPLPWGFSSNSQESILVGEKDCPHAPTFNDRYFRRSCNFRTGNWHGGGRR